MPLHVDVRINDRLIEQYHIGRTEKLVTATQTHQYRVVKGDYQPREVPYDALGVEFTHRYDDGAGVCVQKAIAAWSSSSKVDGSHD